MDEAIRNADLVLRLRRPARRVAKPVTEWNADLGQYMKAWLLESFGREVFEPGVELSGDELRSRLSSVLPVPSALLGLPVADSEGIWWQSCGAKLKEGTLFDKSGFPAIGSIVDGYLKALAEAGLAPTDDLSRAIQDDVRSLVEGLPSRVSDLRESCHVDIECVLAAAKL